VNEEHLGTKENQAHQAGLDFLETEDCKVSRVNKDHLVPQVCQDLLGLEACQVHEVTKVRRGLWVSQVNLVQMVTEVHWV